jgi:hypothetical protein
MKDSNSVDTQSFLYTRSRYYGQFTPANLVFNANLQEFSQRVGFIASLQTSGKVSAEEAYGQIELLWDQLTASKQAVGIGTDTTM